MKNRVAASNPSAIARIKEAFGDEGDLSRWGNLTPEQCHRLGIAANNSDQQKKLVATALRHVERIFQNQAEIERLTAEALALGLKTAEEINGYIIKSAIASAKHEASIERSQHKLGQQLQMIKAETLSDKAIATADFRQRLLLLRANHQSKLAIGQASFSARLREIQAAPRLALQQQKAQRQFDDYINPKPTATPGLAGSPGGGGLWGGIVNFLLGRR